MGLIDTILSTLFGGGRNGLRETVEVFRENAEGSAVRQHDLQSAALQQFAAEFVLPRKGLFDRVMDGVNRLPRPALAMGTLGLFVAAMVDPIWFAARMQGIALVPEPLWWLLGAIVSFYFGARHQMKGQEFQRSLAETLSRAKGVQDNIAALSGMSDSTYTPEPKHVASPNPTPVSRVTDDNPALDEWRRKG